MKPYHALLIIISMATLAWGSLPVTDGLVLYLDAGSIQGTADGGKLAVWSDLSGAGHDATQTTVDNQPMYIAASDAFGGQPAVRFDGQSSWMTLDSSMINVGSFTVLAVGQFNVGTANQYIVAGQNDAGNGRLRIALETTSNPVFEYRGGNSGWKQVTAPADSDIHTFGLTSTLEGFLDGTSLGTTANSSTDNPPAFNIGSYNRGEKDFYDGDLALLLIYNRVLSADEIAQVSTFLMNEALTAGPQFVTHPGPTNGDSDVWLGTSSLSWTGTDSSKGMSPRFRVSLGDSFNDVNDGLVTPVEVDTNTLPLDSPLAYNTTYYWRVEEANSTNGWNAGPVWSFTTEPLARTLTNLTVTANSQLSETTGPNNLINGSGLDAKDLHSTQDTDMWISAEGDQTAWVQFNFDQPYALHDMTVWNANTSVEPLLGLGVQDVNIETSLDGIHWTVYEANAVFNQGTGFADYAANTVVDFNDTVAQYVKLMIKSNWGNLAQQVSLSEVRFSYIPTYALLPDPTDGMSLADLHALLQWRPGRQAVRHEVYLSTDANLVATGDASVLTGTVNTPSLDVTDQLQYDQTYYWQVTEVNDAAHQSRWASPTWSFTTPPYFSVDDMESYNDNDHRIYNSWVDGYNDNTNGSQVGYLQSPFAEQTIVNSGSQSMPFSYDNTSVSVSEAALSLDNQDWTTGGLKTLSIAFRGSADNTGSLFVKINNTKVTYPGDPSRIALELWQTWNIDLTSLSGLQSVTSLTIGVDSAGAKGMLYFDDIRLTTDVVNPDDNTPKPLIIWVSFHGGDNMPSGGAAGAGFTEAPDKAYTDLLKANGYDVIRYITTSTPNPATLDAADLVIIGRSASSSNYQDDGATAWNGITAPMIITGGWTLRSNRMGFSTGTTVVNTTGDITLAVNNPSHPIFSGIDLAGGTMVNPFAGIPVYPTDGTTEAGGLSVVMDPIDNDGTLLATVATPGDPTAGGMVIAEWQAGVTLTHDGGAGTDTLAGHRLVFLTGSTEASGVNTETSGLYDLYTDGEQMFLNAVAYMLQP